MIAYHGGLDVSSIIRTSGPKSQIQNLQNSIDYIEKNHQTGIIISNASQTHDFRKTSFMYGKRERDNDTYVSNILEFNWY